MSVTLKLQNYSDRNTKEISNFASDTPASSTSVTLVNNNNIVANDPIVFGIPGGETTEVRTVQSATGATIVTTDQTKFFHSNNSPVTALYGNQQKVYRAANVDGSVPADSAFAPVGSPIDIDIDQLQTTFTDPSGSSDFWYKYTFLNNLSSSETPLADSVAARGGGYGQYVSIESVRNAAGFRQNRNVSDALIDEKRQVAKAIVDSSLYGRYTLPFAPPINPIIENITRLIAVKYLILDQKGVYATSEQLSDDIENAEAQLEKIKAGQLVLLDSQGNSLASDSGGGDGGSGLGGLGMSSYPNNNTPENEPFLVEVSSIYGYHEREY